MNICTQMSTAIHTNTLQESTTGRHSRQQQQQQIDDPVWLWAFWNWSDWVPSTFRTLLSKCSCRAEVRSSFITTTIRDKSQVTPQGRHLLGSNWRPTTSSSMPLPTWTRHPIKRVRAFACKSLLQDCCWHFKWTAFSACLPVWRTCHCECLPSVP